MSVLIQTFMQCVRRYHNTFPVTFRTKSITNVKQQSKTLQAAQVYCDR